MVVQNEDVLKRVLVIALAAVLMTAGSAAPSEAIQRERPLRILIVGDSVTHGAVGDWTWRYWLWKTLRTGGAWVDFVGPHRGVMNHQTGSRDDPGYANPRFDEDHAARWGMGFATQEYPIEDLVAQYRPDIVIEMLGLNDLIFYGHTPEQVAADAERFIADARSAAPGVKVILGEVPHSWRAGVPELNELLDGVAERTPGAVVAEAPPFVEGVDTYDPLHPSRRGERAIAWSVTSALMALAFSPTFAPPM